MPLSAFIGRDLELARLVELIGRQRMVTLVGPAGIGKTRLALELGARTAHDWPGGVHRVALAALADEVAAARDQIGELWARIAAMLLLVQRERAAELRDALRVIQELERQLGHPWAEHAILRADAILATAESDWWRSRATWWRAIERAATASDLGDLALTLETAAVHAHRAGDAAAVRVLAEALPAGAKGTVLGGGFEHELADLKRRGIVCEPRPGSIWSADALRRVGEVLAGEAAPAPAPRDVEDARAAPPAPDEMLAAAQPARLQRVGDVWQLAFAGHEVQLRQMRGLEDLSRLLGRPDIEVHCLDLMGGGDVGGDAGPALDEQSRREYRARVRDLQAEIEQANDAHDVHRAERAEAELDALVEQLSHAFGLGGRARRTGAAGDRARAAVTWRIRAAIKRIGSIHPELGRHLGNAIRTGTFCAYRPESAMVWDVDPDAGVHVAPRTAPRPPGSRKR